MKITPLIRILVLAGCALLLRQTHVVKAQTWTGDQCIKSFDTASGYDCMNCCSKHPFVTETVGVLDGSRGRENVALNYFDCGGSGCQYANQCPTSVSYYEAYTSATCCGPNGFSCSFDRDCCSGLVCNSSRQCATCVPQHQSCKGGADCCNGICTTGTCCSAFGESCSTSSDCCGNTYICSNGTCAQPGGGGSPIMLDPFDEGFHLTNLSNGVNFRVLPDGPLQQMSWTDANWRNGWLALDRNGNGTIDDFTELFGNFTPQPPSRTPNGFLALAVFDDPANGGNGNGFIDPGDSVYPHLRVWIDANHNGFSEPTELHTLPSLGISKIGLKYHDTPFVDQYGNRFRYKGSVWDQGGNERDICYDVFLQIQQN